MERAGSPTARSSSSSSNVRPSGNDSAGRLPILRGFERDGGQQGAGPWPGCGAGWRHRRTSGEKEFRIAHTGFGFAEEGVAGGEGGGSDPGGPRSGRVRKASTSGSKAVTEASRTSVRLRSSRRGRHPARKSRIHDSGSARLGSTTTTRSESWSTLKSSSGNVRGQAQAENGQDPIRRRPGAHEFRRTRTRRDFERSRSAARAMKGSGSTARAERSCRDP